MNIFEVLNTSFFIFVLLLSRMLGFVLTAPFFGHPNIPGVIKVGFSVLLSYILFPFMLGQYTTDGFIQEMFIFLGIKEFMVGLLLGFIGQIFQRLYAIAGALMDLSMGLMMSQLFDPEIGSQVTLNARYMNIFVYFIFFMINGHHYLLRVIMNSYELVPLGLAHFPTQTLLEYVHTFIQQIFIAGVKISIPILLSILLANVLLAFMAKLMPQMNVFIVGMPLKIFLGFVILWISIPLMAQLIQDNYKDLFSFMYQFLKIIRRN